MHKMELLAPAGSAVALHAAVRAGADAVYLGLESFNARRSAENFTIESLAEACGYAHLRGVNVYVTLNTAILPAETTAVLECARQAWRAGADAFIVQDIGVAAELDRTLPRARLHFSTQMNTHNTAGVRAAAHLGARRVTLARELSLPEIATLAKEATAHGLEVETFVHGALCVCYSGQCFMSSMIGGRSANRGMCAQACRLPYELHNRAQRKPLSAPGDYLLSPQDLCAVDLIPELLEAGVAALKIEGRMKSPEYVFAVTKTYRAVIDRVLTAAHELRRNTSFERPDSYGSAERAASTKRVILSGSPESTANQESSVRPQSSASIESEAGPRGSDSIENLICLDNTQIDETPRLVRARATTKERRSLEEAFSRGFTTAYLEGERGNELMSYQRPNNRGAFVGRVTEASGGFALVAGGQVVVDGDVLEFWTGKGHVAQLVAGVSANQKGHIGVPLDDKAARSVRAGDRVFRVRSVEALYTDDLFEPRIPLYGTVSLKIGQPLRVTFSLAHALSACVGDQEKTLSCECAELEDISAEIVASHVIARLEQRSDGVLPVGVAEGDVVEAARTKAVSAEDVREHIDRLGQTPFRLVSLNIELDEGVGIGFSRLHHVRAAALDNLIKNLLVLSGNRTLPRVSTRSMLPPAHSRGCHIAAFATNPVCARAAKRTGADLLFVSVLNYKRGEAVIAGQCSETAEQAGYPKQSVVAMPAVDHDLVLPSREAVLSFDPWYYAKPDKLLFVDSFGGMQRAAEMGISFDVGPHVPLTNLLSLEVVARLGAKRVWLSPELTLAQIKELAHESPVELGLLVIGTHELMITEHCLLMSQGSCAEDCAHCPRRKSPHCLHDRKDFDFPVITDLLGRSHVYNSVEYDVAQALPDLLAAGVSSYLVDTTLMNGEQTAQAVGRVKRALHVAQNDGHSVAKMPGTTTGHLYRGVS